jgi:hypothetical protein
VYAKLLTAEYWTTPEAGGKVDKTNLTQFGQAMRQLNIRMIAAYSPEARGRSERQFKTLQDRLPKELALRGITEMEAANCRTSCANAMSGRSGRTTA